MEKNKELQFISRINQKCKDAYRELFTEFYQALVLYALKFIDNREEAEDIVQELFVAVWERKEPFKSYTGFRIFLYKTVHNTCLNSLKHEKVRAKYLSFMDHCDNTEDSLDEEMLEEEMYRQLFKTIDMLPPRCRQIFLLHLEGKTNEEIAEELNLSILTVKTQKKHANHFICQKMGALGMYLLLPFII